ncbi:MAG TPA: oxidoreductase [Fulvivirga sp.]|nr:oxidoreductase [Fulvivirga sp.]
MGKTALLIGSTGLIGGQLLDLLLESDRYDQVTTLSRKPIEKKNTKFVNQIADFSKLGSNPEWFKVDDVFCCLGTTIKTAGSQEAFKKVDYEYPLETAKLAKEQGAKQYLIVTALGADANSKIFYNKVKGEVEDAISHLFFDTFHIFRPSLLLGPRKELRIGEKIGQVLFTVLGFLFIGALKKYKGIHSIKVVRAMLAKASLDEKGQYYHESDSLQQF